ncbi:MAG: hypothetical protein M3P51_08945 [Chloroflexota bacterium]|nr:hypothetical protein [Chloroflexota bacterium]
MSGTLHSALEQLVRALTERLESTPAVSQPNSVELAVNSKGTSYSVKAYAPTVEEASAAAQAEYDRLAAKYSSESKGA